MKYSLAVAALLSLLTKNEVLAINSASTSDLSAQTNEQAYVESGRFIGSDGKAINLA